MSFSGSVCGNTQCIFINTLKIKDVIYTFRLKDLSMTKSYFLVCLRGSGQAGGIYNLIIKIFIYEK